MEIIAFLQGENRLACGSRTLSPTHVSDKGFEFLEFLGVDETALR